MVPLKTHSQELGRSGTAFWVKVLWYLLYHYLETGNPIMPLNGLPVCELLQGFERIDEHFSSRPHSQSDGVLSPLGAQIHVLQMQPVQKCPCLLARHRITALLEALHSTDFCTVIRIPRNGSQRDFTFCCF